MKAMKTMKAAPVMSDEDDEGSSCEGRKAMKAMKAMKTKKVTVSKFARKSLGMLSMKGKKGEGTEAGKDVALLKKPAAAMKRNAAQESEGPAAKKKKPADQTDVLAARKAELKKMLVADIKELVLKKGLEKGSKDDMIEAILKKEKAALEAEKAIAEKRKKVMSERTKALEAMSNQGLKDLCESKGLKTGGSKPDKVERLLSDIKANGEVDRILAEMARAERHEELSKMSKDDLLKICSKSKIDPIVKEVMVERIVVHEAGLKA